MCRWPLGSAAASPEPRLSPRPRAFGLEQDITRPFGLDKGVWATRLASLTPPPIEARPGQQPRARFPPSSRQPCFIPSSSPCILRSSPVSLPVRLPAPQPRSPTSAASLSASRTAAPVHRATALPHGSVRARLSQRRLAPLQPRLSPACRPPVAQPLGFKLNKGSGRL